MDKVSLPTSWVLPEALVSVVRGHFPLGDSTAVSWKWVFGCWSNTGPSTQLQPDGRTQDKCSHIVGDLAHAYEEKQHGIHLEVLGEDLQEAEARLHAHGHEQHVLPTEPGRKGERQNRLGGGGRNALH